MIFNVHAESLPTSPTVPYVYCAYRPRANQMPVYDWLWRSDELLQIHGRDR